MMNNMPASMPALRSTIDLLKESWNRFARRWKFFVLYVLVSTLVPGAMFLIGGLLAALLGAGGLFFGGEMALGGAGIVAIVLLSVAVLAAIYVSILFTVGLMLAVVDENLNSIKAAVMAAKPKALDYFFISLIVGLIVLAGTVLLILPGIYLAICYAFAAWVYVLEGKKGMDALRESKSLVSGRWWAVFGRFVLFGIIIWLVMILPQGIFGALKLDALAVIYNIVASFVVGPVSSIFVYLFYKNLKGSQMAAPQPMSQA